MKSLVEEISKKAEENKVLGNRGGNIKIRETTQEIEHPTNKRKEMGGNYQRNNTRGLPWWRSG